jgi:hypothetical protein
MIKEQHTFDNSKMEVRKMSNEKASNNKTKPKKKGNGTDEPLKNKPSLLQLLQFIATILVIFGIIFGVYRFIDDRYALKNELKSVEIRLEILEIKINLQDIEDRICYLSLKTKRDPEDEKQIMKLESKRGSLEKEKDFLFQSLKFLAQGIRP